MITYYNTSNAQDKMIDEARGAAISGLEILAEEWDKTLGELYEANDRIAELERQIEKLEEELREEG